MHLLFVCILLLASVWAAPDGQKRASCGHFMPQADLHDFCAPCRKRKGLCAGPAFPCTVCVTWSPDRWLRAAARRPSDSRGHRATTSPALSQEGVPLLTSPPVIDRSVGSPRSSDRVTATPLSLPPCDRVTPGQPAATRVLPGSADGVPTRPVNQKGLRKQLKAAARKLKEASKRARGAADRDTRNVPESSAHRSPGGGTEPPGSDPGDTCPVRASNVSAQLRRLSPGSPGEVTAALPGQVAPGVRSADRHRTRGGLGETHFADSGDSLPSHLANLPANPGIIGYVEESPQSIGYVFGRDVSASPARASHTPVVVQDRQDMFRTSILGLDYVPGRPAPGDRSGAPDRAPARHRASDPSPVPGTGRPVPGGRSSSHGGDRGRSSSQEGDRSRTHAVDRSSDRTTVDRTAVRSTGDLSPRRLSASRDRHRRAGAVVQELPAVPPRAVPATTVADVRPKTQRNSTKSGKSSAKSSSSDRSDATARVAQPAARAGDTGRHESRGRLSQPDLHTRTTSDRRGPTESVRAHVHPAAQEYVPPPPLSREPLAPVGEEQSVAALISSLLQAALPGIVTAVANQVADRVGKSDPVNPPPSGKDGASRGRVTASASTSGPEPTGDLPAHDDAGDDDGYPSSDLGEKSSDDSPQYPPSSRQALQTACETLPPTLVQTTESKSRFRSAVLSPSEIPGRTSTRFQITDLVSSALESVHDAMLGIATSTSPADALSLRKEMWRTFSGPLVAAGTEGKSLTRDRPKMADLASAQAMFTNTAFRKHLGIEPDLVKGVGTVKSATVSTVSLEHQEDLLREVMLLHSGVDSFLTALRKKLPSTSPEVNSLWREASRSLWSASLQTGKALANVVGQRRDVVTKSVSGFSSCSHAQLRTLRAAPLDGSTLFGGLFETFCERSNKNPTLMAFAKSSGPSSGGSRARKRKASRGGGSSAKRPRLEQPAQPSYTEPFTQQKPRGSGGKRGGKRGDKNQGRFSRGARGGARRN